MQGLTAIVGIRVGHASNFDALTGCTAILCEAGAGGGVDIRGSASETSSIDTLQPGHITGLVHGIALSGGSAFGREAACGVRHYLEQRGAGFRVGRGKQEEDQREWGSQSWLQPPFSRLFRTVDTYSHAERAGY